MKKLVLATLVMLAFAQLESLAQESNGKTRAFGVRAGWQNSVTVMDGDQIGGGLSNFYVGVFGDRPLGASDILFYTGGLEYMKGGWETDDNNFKKIHYLSGPASLKAKFGPVFLQAGPTFNFRLGESYVVEGEDALTDGNKTDTFDLLLHAGAGIKISIFSIEARYNFGLMEYNAEGHKNGYFQLGAGISF